MYMDAFELSCKSCSYCFPTHTVNNLNMYHERSCAKAGIPHDFQCLQIENSPFKQLKWDERDQLASVTKGIIAMALFYTDVESEHNFLFHNLVFVYTLKEFLYSLLIFL